MNDHPRELLPLIAEGMRPAPEVRRHLSSCDTCRAALEALSPLDLGLAWDGVVAEIDAPRRRLAERVLVRLGVEEGAARFVCLTPSLRSEWLLATLGALGLAAVGMLGARGDQISLVLLVAPLVAAAIVAFAYGPLADPAFEIVAASPLSPLLALLLRLAAVLTVTSALVFGANLAAGGSAGHAAWFLPMTFVALFAAAVALKTTPFAGAGAGMLAWSAAVFVSVALAADPARTLWGDAAQIAYGTGSALLLAGLLVSVARSGGFHVPRPIPRRGM
ncbi:MAG: hypothetical protein M3273_00145 [Actinomycetota bacterium]|nr:hypothetical protein [Actinomycetota bacterium]